MKKIFSKTAFTLIELIVSLTLVSVIVLGIVTIMMVLSNNGQDYGQRYLVKSETQTTLNHILNDASLATGSGTKVGFPVEPDTGILIGAAMGAANNNQFCIHQNQGAVTWVCYTFDPVAFQIAYCKKAYDLLDPTGFRGASGACVGAPTFLGSAYNITHLNGVVSPPTFAASAAAPPQLQFTITIQNCLNNATPPGTCSATGTSTDPVNNPEAQITGTVSMQQEGTG